MEGEHQQEEEGGGRECVSTPPTSNSERGVLHIAWVSTPRARAGWCAFSITTGSTTARRVGTIDAVVENERNERSVEVLRERESGSISRGSDGSTVNWASLGHY